MGNVLYGQVKSYFSVPAEFVTGGHLRDLLPSAIRLYVFLMHLAQKHTATVLEVADWEVKQYTGLDEKSTRTARAELATRGLVLVMKGRVYSYRLLDPATDKPILPPADRGGVRRYSGRKALPSEPPSAEVQKEQQAKPPQSRVATPLGVKPVCYVHGKSDEFWTRPNGKPVCSKCHPDPFGGAPVAPLTAKDVGF